MVKDDMERFIRELDFSEFISHDIDKGRLKEVLSKIYG